MFNRLIFKTEKYVFSPSNSLDFENSSYLGFDKEEYESKGYNDSRVLYFAPSLEYTLDDLRMGASLAELIKKEFKRIREIHEDDKKCPSIAQYKGVDVSETIECMKEYFKVMLPTLESYLNSLTRTTLLVDIGNNIGIVLKGYNRLEHYMKDSVIEDLTEYVDLDNAKVVDMGNVLFEDIEYLHIPKTGKNHSILSLYRIQGRDKESKYMLLNIYSKEGTEVVCRDAIVKLGEVAKEEYERIVRRSCGYTWELEKERYYLLN